MTKHALLSASAASRWLKCTAAPRYEAQFPETVSEYAEEGRLAHSVCELKVLRKYTPLLTQRQYTSQLNKLKKNALYSDEMDRTSDAYLDHIAEKAMSYASPPLVSAEVRVDFPDIVPEGFGTCDCVMVGGDTLDIIDYKHGRGVPVASEGNAQMRLYALGALRKYAPFYGESIRQVRMAVVQPRLYDAPTSETITVEELQSWGDSIKPLALKAYSGFGDFVPGDHCRFCRGKAQCRARADAHTALEDFKHLVLPTAENQARRSEAAGDAPAMLTHAEIGDLLTRGKTLLAWYTDLAEYSLGAILKGEEIPGWKAIAGRSNRAFTDHDAAAAAVIASGYDEALVYDRRLKSITELENLMGKADFAEKIGTYVYKPPGKPALAPASDARPPYSSTASDFAGVGNAVT
ncbi:MAG: DUF2800 domain-containing protein [Gracilibacteraceae bacterium]|jgi:hypothetical protein|nr:DUF2800 domain-containing protein [Gracilibacteraceae bacterium]